LALDERNGEYVGNAHMISYHGALRASSIWRTAFKIHFHKDESSQKENPAVIAATLHNDGVGRHLGKAKESITKPNKASPWSPAQQATRFRPLPLSS
jgi:hypothetical protein